MQVALSRVLKGAAMTPKAAEMQNCLKMEGFGMHVDSFSNILKLGGGVALRTLPQGGFKEAKEAALETLP